LRLSGRLKSIILESVEDSFGPVDVYLFGSRTNDALRGGDIDIAIGTTMDYGAFRTGKAQFRTALYRRGLDLKVDLVQYSSDTDSLFKAEIDSSKIKL